MTEEEEKEIKIKIKASTAASLLIILLIIIVIMGLYIYYMKVKSTENNAGNNPNIAAIENNIMSTVLNTVVASIEYGNTVFEDTPAAYENYKDILWTRTTGITYPAGDTNGFAAWVDDKGIIHASYPGDDGQKKETEVNSLPEKAEYVTIIGQVQQMGGESLLVLTKNHNLYVINGFHTEDGVLTDKPAAVKFASNILDIYKDEQVYSGNSIIPTILTDGGGGTFSGIYALTSEGKLLSINADTSGYVLGLSYEDCNAVKGTVFMPASTLQITNDDYLRGASNVQADYIINIDNNNMIVKYIFIGNDGTDNDEVYVVSADNKIYYVGVDGSGNYYPGKLLNDKTVKSISDGNKAVTVTYTNYTTERFNHRVNWDSYGEGKSKYGF